MLDLKPTIGQLSNFRHYASQDEHLKIFDWDSANFDRMTLKQFNYCKALWTNNNYFKLKEVLSSFIKKI